MNDEPKAGAKAFAYGNVTVDTVKSAKDYLKIHFDRLSEGGRKSKRQPIDLSPAAEKQRERMRRYRARKAEQMNLD